MKTRSMVKAVLSGSMAAESMRVNSGKMNDMARARTLGSSEPNNTGASGETGKKMEWAMSETSMTT